MTESTLFKKIAKQYDGAFYEKRSSHFASTIGSIATRNYDLKFTYKNAHIRYQLQFGTGDLGTINCTLLGSFPTIKFDISTSSPWIQLFSPKKSVFEVQASTTDLTLFFQKNTALEELSSRAKKDKFQPSFNGRNLENGYEISCIYDLSFTHKELVIAPMVQFFVSIVDYLNRAHSMRMS